MCSPSYSFHGTPVVTRMCVYTARKNYYINYKKVPEQERKTFLQKHPYFLFIFFMFFILYYL